MNRDGSLVAASLANAATVWINHDRHARAYRTLEGVRSREILKRLRQADARTWQEADPVREERCLACHTTPTLASAALNDQSAVLSLRQEGVSCDACHTRPGADSTGWVDLHARGGLMACYQDPALGLLPLKETKARAKVCAGCHVGAPADSGTGIPLRDMHHDLIAAGHPRFFFDYATYVQLLPPHWQDDVHPPSVTPLVEVAAGVQAQFVLLDAELTLLKDRVQRAAPWPEFASFDCERCHHELRSPSWQQQVRTGAQRGLAEWTGWSSIAPWRRSTIDSLPESAQAAALLTLSLSRFGNPDPGSIDLLQKTIRNRLADSTPPAREATSLSLEELLPPVEHFTSDQTTAAENMVLPSWTIAARLYYLACEVERIRQLRSSSPPGSSSVTQTALKQLREELVISTEKTASPSQFDPRKATDGYQAVRTALLQRWSEEIVPSPSFRQSTRPPGE